MNDPDFKQLLTYLNAIAQSLGEISSRLGPEAPNFQRPLAEYRAFDWSGIGAVPDEEDNYGVAVVSYGGYQWKRRHGTGKYGKAIWFSRASGRNEEGEADYLRLVTFKDLAPVEPLSADLVGDAEAFHLTYADGMSVPRHGETIRIFNAFIAEKQRKPADRDELIRWHKGRM